MNRLFRQDALIMWHIMQTTFARWSDRFMASSLLLGALFVGHSSISRLPWAHAAWIIFAVAIAVGIGAGRLISARLVFHRCDGLFVADALQPRIQRFYIFVWHGAGAALLAAIILIVSPYQVITSLVGYAVGMVSALLADTVITPRLGAINRPSRRMALLNTNTIGAGGGAAVILCMSALALQRLAPNSMEMIISIEALLAALILLPVDYETVHFMAISGRPSRQIFAYHLKGISTYLALVLPGIWILDDLVTAGVITASSSVAVLFLGFRVLTYQQYRKRFADFLVSGLAGLLMVMTYLMPVSLPLIAGVMLWLLQRQANHRRWLIA